MYLVYLRVVLIVPKFAGDEELAPVDAGSGQTGLDPRSDLRFGFRTTNKWEIDAAILRQKNGNIEISISVQY